MPTVFTAREIAETAVEKEMKRRDFYANVTKLSTDPEMTKLFKFLTEEEDRHVATFVKLRDGVPVEEKCPKCGADLVMRFGRYGATLILIESRIW